MRGQRLDAGVYVGTDADAQTISYLIARHLGIDLLRPSIDPARQVVDVAESTISEVLRRRQASLAMVAAERDRCFPVELLDKRNPGVVQKARPFDSCNVPLL